MKTENITSFILLLFFLFFILFSMSIFLYSFNNYLIVPFISVYTKGISDTNYIQPLFAFILVSAHAIYCLRLPYNVAILAGGHFKQTQKCYIIGAVLNIVLSVAVLSIIITAPLGAFGMDLSYKHLLEKENNILS